MRRRGRAGGGSLDLARRARRTAGEAAVGELTLRANLTLERETESAYDERGRDKQRQQATATHCTLMFTALRGGSAVLMLGNEKLKK